MGILLTPPDEIERQFAACLGVGALRLVSREIASQGLSDETGLLDFVDDTGRQIDLVVRCYRPGGVARHEVDPGRHFRVLRALQGGPVPVPEALWYEPDPALFGGSFFVMRRVTGFVPVPWSTEGKRYLAAAGAGPIGQQFVNILAAIHALDYGQGQLSFLPSPPAGTGFAERCVAEVEQHILDNEIEPEPVLADGIGWLRANLPTTEHVALVHGDYRTGNLMFGGDEVRAVLDWEFTRLGDVYFDLGWVCAPSNRIDSDLVCMLIPYEEFLRRYQQASGLTVDEHVLQWWVMFHQVRHAGFWLNAGASYASGRTDDLRLARMAYAMPKMRRMVAELLETA